MGKISRTCICMGLLLIAVALCFCGYNLYDEYRATGSARKVAEQLVYSITQNIEKPSYDVPMSEVELPDYVLEPGMEMPILTIDGYSYIGTVEIPTIDVLLPVMEQWSYTNLKITPCRYYGSAYLDNMVIAAHNYSSHFGKLNNLNIGDKVIFTDIDGNVFNYEVVSVETLSAEDVEGMISGEYALSLFTCTVGGQYRVTVRCEKT